MSDLIDRQTAIDIINTYAVPIHGYIGTPNDSEVFAYARGLLLSIERNMRALPSAQPERKKGEWILYENQRQEDVDNDNYLYICSECGKSDLHAKTQKVPFCWNCGARMDAETCNNAEEKLQ